MKRVNSESNAKQGLGIAESCASSTIVKTKIFTVTFSRYHASDHFMLDDSLNTANADEALALYKEWKREAYDIAHNPDELDEERVKNGTCRLFDVFQDERTLGEVSRGYIVSRAKGTQDEFQARVFIREQEVELPANIVVPAKNIGEKMT